MDRSGETEGAPYPCPACGQPLYAWAAARHPLDGSKVYLDQCESCGLTVTRAKRPPDPAAELEGLESGGELIVPNRRSFAAGIGGPGWAEMRPDERRLHLTPRSAELLYGKQGQPIEVEGTPFTATSYLGMLQTMVNAFTLRDNFVANARRGRLRPEGAKRRLAYALDAAVTALVSIPLALIALPTEALGARLGRGGLMRISDSTGAQAPAGPESAERSGPRVRLPG